MDRRFFYAAALSILILVAWTWIFPPPRPARLPPEPSPDVRTAEAPAEGAAPEPIAPPAVEAERVEAEAAATTEIDNGVFRVVLSNEGAGPVSWKLVDYTIAGEPTAVLPSFVESQRTMLSVQTGDPALDERINRARYHVEHEQLPAAAGEPSGQRVRFRWADGQGVEVEKSLVFRTGSYLVGIDLRVTAGGRPQPARIAVGPGFSALPAGGGGNRTYYYEAVLWNDGGHVVHRKKGSLPEEPVGIAGDLRWAGLEDQYFAAVLVPSEPQRQAGIETVALVRTGPNGEPGASEIEALVSVPVPESGVLLFVGPKQHRLLSELGHELDKTIWFSSYGLLAWIARQIFLALLWLHDHTIQNYGLAIILATFLLRLLLFPVNQYSMVSMKKTQLQMQRLQPKVKAIRNKYKKNKDIESRNRMNQEMMELYKREGVNPMGGLNGCLPLLAQFPILISFYNMLTVAVELRGAPFFGWIRDLSTQDPWYVIPLLMGVTMFVQQRMAMTKVTDPQQLQQQRIMLIMPVVFTIICVQMPSGMVLYWFVNNLLGIGQQWLVNRHTARLEAAAEKA